jgi:hypothetical protein
MSRPTYDLISSTTLASSSSSVTFSLIPDTYRDLILVVEGSGSSPDSPYLTLNGDTTNANYRFVRMFGTGSGSGGSDTGSSPEVFNHYTGRGTHIIQIMDYSATDRNKTALSRSNTASVVVMAHVVRWANTAAVNSVGLRATGSTFASGNTFSLYGVIA